MNIKSFKILSTSLLAKTKTLGEYPYNVEEKTIRFLLLLLFTGFINSGSYPVQGTGNVLECDLFHYL